MQKIALWLQAGLLVLGIGLGWQIGTLKESVAAYVRIKDGTQMASIVIEWVSGGNKVVFTCTRQPDETVAAWRARAEAEYAAMLQAFPKDE